MEKWMKEKADKINWFLDFVQNDLSALSSGDRAKLCYEAKEIIFDHSDLDIFEDGFSFIGDSVWPDPDMAPPSEEPPETIPVPDEVVEKTAKDWAAAQEFPDILNIDEYFRKLKDMQNHLKFFIGRFIQAMLERKPFPFLGLGNKIVAVPKAGRISIAFAPNTTELPFLALFRFVSQLDEMPIEGFKKCLECRKIFYYPHKRKKDFCSLECSWRYFARQRRQSDPESYKKYQAKLMRERYQEKKKRKHSPNTKIAKVKQRAKKQRKD